MRKMWNKNSGTQPLHPTSQITFNLAKQTSKRISHPLNTIEQIELAL